MRRKRLVERVLDVGTGAAVVAALVVVAHDRLLPAWRARQLVEPGERIPPDLVLERLDAPGIVRPGDVRPAVLFLFQSTCAACERAVPGWTEVLEGLAADVRPLAVALESAEGGLAYARQRLPGALPTRPLDEARFTARLGITVVPTTLVVDAAGTLRLRVAGVPGSAAVDSIARLAAGAAGRDPAASPRGSR